MLIRHTHDCQSSESTDATICVWDVNFDCIIDDDDVQAILDFIDECVDDPCYCGGSSGFAYAPGEGLSIERFTEAIAASASEMTDAQLAHGWELFLSVYAN